MGIDAKIYRVQGSSDAAMPAQHSASYAAPMLAHSSPYALSGTDGAGHMRKLEDIESEVIRMAISRYDGHMSEVARRLGIGRSTLYRKLKELGLEPSDAEMTVESGGEPRHAAG
jgi:DNA-binding NtrC family response regulator